MVFVKDVESQAKSVMNQKRMQTKLRELHSSPISSGVESMMSFIAFIVVTVQNGMWDIYKGETVMNTSETLQLVLDHIDYTNGACRPNEAIGAILPVRVLDLAKESLEGKRLVRVSSKCIFCENGEAHTKEHCQKYELR